MDECRKGIDNKPNNNLKGVIQVSTIAEVNNQKQQKETNQETKFHILRKQIAVSSMTKKGLVELYKEGK
ncbi:hypothetical protein NC661_04070 [Aquibacillus koreensis]|uniref:Uncharacterized protein n=1 Tax=Aquibacillus koreensis TaxID=279446 RepID=A0A9X3WJ41_9BACI|nr:hypothetical protein [Aquibacillus koreensis]MCT2534851.1 hypothetical protein [Aquibacillus koreensis]MDC3419538.1 hypothetical protein [Aquibacillus koreensis]